MRNAQGYATIAGPDGIKECDTFTCNHCQRITHVKPKMDPADLGGFCRICSKLICNRCVGRPCDPFMEKFYRMEARYHALRSYGAF